MPEYTVREGSLQQQFLASRAKIQMYAGGFANGKTSGVCVKTLQVAKDYPGANILMARSTYPKLNDTLRKELLKWCPNEWRKSFSKSENILELKNGTTIAFRYMAQQGKSTESSTSNLLSANYDLVVVDQIEDPEIIEKDFLDLLGRLRGHAKYIGSDPTMPKSGPRWMFITSNPTRNWVYRSLVRPLHRFLQLNIRDPQLLVDKTTKQPIIQLFEGSTYANKDNLEADYISTLESAYTGQMKERFLLGHWAAYEGLVYPQYADETHTVPVGDIQNYLVTMRKAGYQINFVEGYDYGLAVPSCYLAGIVSPKGDIIIIDGFYEAELTIDEMSRRIMAIRDKWHIPKQQFIHADPAIFKRGTSTKTAIGQSIARMYQENGINMTAGSNDIISGITKIQGYLLVQENHRHPIYDTVNAPYLYHSQELEFISNEFTEYYWKKDSLGEREDRPIDRNDHAMDTIKYLMTSRPQLSVVVPTVVPTSNVWTKWGEQDIEEQDKRSHRHRR